MGAAPILDRPRIDPAQRLIRNTYRDDAATFHQLGLHLRHGTGPPEPITSEGDSQGRGGHEPTSDDP